MSNEEIKNLIFVDCEGHGPAPALNDSAGFEFGAVAYHSRQTFHGIGENKFFAIAQICEIGKGKINHDLGEVWGKNKNEAEKKMLKKIEVWLDKK